MTKNLKTIDDVLLEMLPVAIRAYGTPDGKVNSVDVNQTKRDKVKAVLLRLLMEVAPEKKDILAPFTVPPEKWDEQLAQWIGHNGGVYLYQRNIRELLEGE